jgi:hypothetical protein
MIEIVMFFSGWWYFSKLNKRIEQLETEVMILRLSNIRTESLASPISIGTHPTHSFGPNNG